MVIPTLVIYMVLNASAVESVCIMGESLLVADKVAIRLGRDCESVNEKEFFSPSVFGRDRDFIPVMERIAAFLASKRLRPMARRSHISPEVVYELVDKGMGAIGSFRITRNGFRASFYLSSTRETVVLSTDMSGRVIGMSRLLVDYE